MPTEPGLHHNFDLAKYPATIRNAIRRIADTFYVTRSFDAVRIDNSVYYGALIRPTDDSSVVLNTQRELLVVFSDYQTFEIRTLEAFEEFYSLLDSARVDHSLRFLVSSDGSVDRHIKLYLEQHPEYPVIIPVTFERLERHTNPLIAAVRQNHHIRDLFGFQSPLREEHFFFGRSDIVASVIDLGKSGQHSSIFGLRKSGKTSTIYAIERRCKPTDLTVLTIDCQDLQIHGRRYGELLVHIVNKVREKNKLKQFSKPIANEGPEISEWFYEKMGITLDSLRSNLLIIFDEIENISPRTAASEHWRSKKDPIYFWQIIRSFAQSRKNRYLAVCIVGTSPYILEEAKIQGIDNPAYLLAQKRFIPNLSFDETREMVGRLGFFMGLDFDASAVSMLHASYGGHPFFTRQVCSKVHQITTGQRPKAIPKLRVQQAQTEFSAQLESYLYGIVSNLKDYYPEEFKILKQVVTGQGDEANEFAREAPDLIDHLVGYGLLVIRDETAELAFEAVKKAVLQVSPDDNLLSIEGKWAELCLRRNRIETEIRSNLFYWSKSINQLKFEEILSNFMTKKRFEALKNLDPRILFSGEHSPLYLTDFLSLIESDEVLPYISDNRSIIRQNIHRINKYRADAHAKIISDDDFTEACEAFEYLEAIFF